ncbi:ABC transporter substrate-binding protein [Castellaniella caeni]|uniref:ABC transporter substrate-binding protein n=1 Tax=Castellaniella caeni TaxID=266123 RepID=UPI00082C58C0|nr:ABC transporter substrate-binding protein [Castellaniella caeni]
MVRGLGKICVLSAVALCLQMGSAAADEILVGVEGPMTGALAREGGGMIQGVEVAAELFNKSQSKHTIKLVKIDDESQPAKAVAAVEKLAGEGAVAITGGYGSNNVGPASDAANKLGLPYITSGAVADGLTQRGFKTFFRVNNTAGYQKALVGLMETMKIESVSVLYSTKEANAHLAADTEKEMASKGVKVIMHAFDPATTDFKPLINKVRLKDKADVILMVGYENDYVGILRAAKVLKPKVKAMIGVWGLVTPKMMKEFPDVVQNVFGTAALPYPVEFTSPEGKAFAEAYEARFKDDVGYLQQFGYVQGKILFEAIARAADKGTLKSGGVAQELAATDAQTLIGRVQFNEQGDNINFAHHIGQIQGDKIVLVWPEDAATGKMAYPGVPW